MNFSKKTKKLGVPALTSSSLSRYRTPLPTKTPGPSFGPSNHKCSTSNTRRSNETPHGCTGEAWWLVYVYSSTVIRFPSPESESARPPSTANELRAQLSTPSPTLAWVYLRSQHKANSTDDNHKEQAGCRRSDVTGANSPPARPTMRWLLHLRLLVWKNFVLQRRRPWGTIIEILVPSLLFMALLGVRTTISSKEETPESFCSYPVSIFDFYRPVQNGDDNDNNWGLPKSHNCNPYTVWVNYIDEDGFTGIGFAPNTTETRAIMDQVETYYKMAPSDQRGNLTFNGFDTEDEIQELTEDDTLKYLLGIVFYTDETHTTLGHTPGNQVYYKIRPRDDTAGGFGGWRTGRSFPEFEQLGPQEGNVYRNRNGVSFFQNLVDTAFISTLQSNSAPQTVVRVKAMPFPEYEDDGFIFAIRIMFPLILILSFLYSALSIVKSIVLEKEKRLKEALRMMGVSNTIIWAAWFVKSLLFLFLSIIIIIVIFAIGNILKYSSNVVVFIFLMLYAISTIAYCFLISTLFTKASTAASAAGILFFLGYVPYFFIQNSFETLGDAEKHSACLLSPTCVGIGAQILSRFEANGLGLSMSTLSRSPTEKDSFSMATVFGMLILDTILYLVLTWYIENVAPGTYGVPKKPWFFLLPSYWGCCRAGQYQVSSEEMGANSNGPDEQNVEPDPPNAKAGISIQNLRKVYQGAAGTKLAVDGLSLNLFEGQVTALLGHNGAGKTTTMSILVGLFPPSGGTAYINGYDIRKNIEAVRDSLGLCPQYDVLWDDLSVAEHCYFFGRLKGLKGKKLRAEMDEFVKDLDLEPKRHARSATLSGGQKRALSVALAFTGGSKVVILDEPTSGMDPYKRRHTWNVLLKHKKDRTLLLTTHFMDEADLLGDRIAIMAAGKLCTVGSSRFLKDRFGVGYHLTLVKNPSCDVRGLSTTISHFSPGSHLMSDVGAELTYILPKHESENFPTLFEHLESRRDQYGIDSYGISATTMEEVFLRVGHGEEGSDKERASEVNRLQSKRRTKSAPDDQSVLIPPGQQHSRLATGNALRLQQFRAMFVKRALHSRRHIKTLLAQTLIPVLFAIAALSIAKAATGNSDEPERVLGLNLYDDNTAFATDVNSGGDYWSWASPTGATVLGNDGSRTPSTLQLDLMTQTSAFLGNNADDRVAKTTFSDVGDVNFTNSLNTANADHLSNDFFKKHVAAFTFEQGAFQMIPSGTDECLFRTGPTFPTDFTAMPGGLTLETNNTYTFQMFAFTGNPDFYIEDQFSVRLDVTDRLYNDGHSDAAWRTLSWVVPDGLDGQTFSLFCANGATATTLTVTDTPGAGSTPNGVTALAWFNEQAIHSSVEAANAAANIIARAEVDPSALVHTSIHPLPKSTSDEIDSIQSDSTGFNLALFMIFGTGFLQASFALFLVTERATKAKHLQFVSGAGPVTFWLATFAWDLINVLVPAVLMLIAFACFDVPAFRGRLHIVALLLVLFGWAGLPFVYLLQRPFQVASNAYAKLSMLFIFGSIGLLVTVFVMTLLDLDDEAEIVRSVGYIVPNYAMSQALLDMFYNYNYNDICRQSASQLSQCAQQGIIPRSNYLDMNQFGVGLQCLYMAGLGVLYFIVLLYFELSNVSSSDKKSAIANKYAPTKEDEDVAAERQRVQSGRADDAVVVDSLTKVFYPPKRPPLAAVRGLSFGLPKGECFGLLGVNGAGKTTTFKMLTGDEPMSAGSAVLNGHDLATELKTVRQYIGYCPQFDALIGQLTGREMLTLYARLRGVQERDIAGLVQNLVERLDLVKYADRQCYSYSGGNKRKLSTAIALIGNPVIVFLDEPTTGMDPGARRFLWDVLTDIQSDHCIVLTSHSMEECEALCNRLAIMVNGQFKCIGSPQHLKHRFGKGYSLVIKLAASPSLQQDTADVKHHVERVFNNAVLKEEYNGEVTYQIEDVTSTWSQLFAHMENAKAQYPIEDYVLSQTSLEQVFLGFAATQNDTEI
eukprot:m.359766 g.359766  ORF g.359766 m.359766 type:complete len:1971 (+) comp19951_c3_seq13:616-6528(+)